MRSRDLVPPPEPRPPVRERRGARIHREVHELFRAAGARTWRDDDMVSARVERRIR